MVGSWLALDDDSAAMGYGVVPIDGVDHGQTSFLHYSFLQAWASLPNAMMAIQQVGILVPLLAIGPH